MDDITEDDEGVAIFDGRPFTGVAFELDAGQRPASELTFQSGVVHGTARDFYPDGQMKGETTYRNGSRHGVEREWYKDGMLSSESRFELDILVARKEWDSSRNQVFYWRLQPTDPQYKLLEILRRKHRP